MSQVVVKNLAFIRSARPDAQDLPMKIAEALESIAQAASNGQQQTNANPTGEPNAPPKVQGVNVTGQNGFLHVAIKDTNPIYRGIRYYVEHADNPHFTDSQIVPIHDARNVTIPVGNQTRYVRAYSAYSTSPPNEPVHFGSPTQPTAVNGGGSDSGPAFLPSEGSGTGAAGVGLQGPGKQPYRPVAGAPPVR